MSYEERLENKDAYQKTLDFHKQMAIVKLLQQKYMREKNLSSSEAQSLAWKNVRSGYHHLEEDLDEEKVPESKPQIVSEKKIGLVSEEKAKLLKIYEIVRKICNKNKQNVNYQKLEKYFVNLNKKIH
jgi:RAB protein geranylgeranyltransferase component A